MAFRILLLMSLAAAAVAAQIGRSGDSRELGGAQHQVQELEITILSSQVAESLVGRGEWGFAALVESDGRKLLFDTGSYSDTVLQNAELLGIDLSQVEDVVLSHNHGDHTGGLLELRRALMQKNPKALHRAYAAPTIMAPRRNNPPGWMPMDALKKEFEAMGGKFVFVEEPQEVLPGLWLTGPVPRPHDESSMYPLVRIEVELEGKWHLDTVPEDMPLVAVTKDGVFLLTGCGHAGLVNSVQFARKLTGQPVAGAVGGFHLFLYSDDELRWTAEQLRNSGVETLSGAHCTGIESIMKLRQLLDATADRVYVSGVGAAFRSENRGARPKEAKF
jgi:7,8-dihydropterin-6-yl-methyl-4-(beta-D-ribofuranosyl)aminobenzene 5'-phosphate synthase